MATGEKAVDIGVSEQAADVEMIAVGEGHFVAGSCSVVVGGL
jgi:hypothetical protein